MPCTPDELKTALRQLVKEDPAFLDELLGREFLRNPYPYRPEDPRLRVDPTARLAFNAHVEAMGEATIEIGPHCYINHFAWLRAWGPGLKIGAHCTLNHYAMLQGGVTLGDGVRIGAHAVFVATEHRFARRDVPIYQQGVGTLGIMVEDDVYVGSNVVVLDGVRIGKGAVLAAGAVVSRDVPPYTIVGGVPARVIKERPR